MYSNGANQKFGTKVKIAGGVVTATVSQIDADHPDNNKMGADDYVLAVVYTYTNGYGETAAITEGFSNNQQFLTGNGGGVSNDVTPGENGGTLQLPAENPSGDLQNYFDVGNWSSIKALAQANLSKDDYKNKYGIEPGDTIVSNGTTYVLVDLGTDNNGDGVQETGEDYDGFVFMYNTDSKLAMNSTSATNDGGYAASELAPQVEAIYNNLADSEFKSAIKEVTITCNDYGSNKPATHEYTAHIFLASAKEIGCDVSGWNFPDGYMAEGICFDLFTTSDSSRIGFMSTANVSSIWWLRSANADYYGYFQSIVANSHWSYNKATTACVVVPAFVIG
jgi:hypothetical protein